METLFTLETSRVRLTWSGLRTAPGDAPPLRIQATDASEVWIDGERRTGAPVWLAEETTYAVLLQSLDGAPVTLSHRDPVVVAGLVSADGGRVVHGRVRFGSQAGRSTFGIESGSRDEVRLEVSVLPTKLNEADVAAMRAEVEAVAAGLAVAAVRPARLRDAGGSVAPSAPVWLAALRQSADVLVAAMREIDRRPVLDTVRGCEDVAPHRVRRPTSETRNAAYQRGIEAPSLPARPAQLTADTPAHRWLAARLDAVLARLRQLADDEAARSSTARRRVLVDEIETLAQRIARVRRHGVLEGAGARVPSVPPLVLRRQPAYVQAFEALRALDRGLALRDGALDVATQDLAVLFETWAALAVVRTVAEALGVEPPARPFGIDARGADVRLRRGRAHAVRLAGRGAEVEVVNTPRFPAPPGLLVQRPDLLLTVRRGEHVQRVVLDAKYRRDDSDAYRRRYGAAGPPEDALNTLHRYRDAIPGHVTLAAALFPGASGDPIYEARLWTSLADLGVGAVSLRPGDTAALTRLIGRVVG